MFGAKEPDRPTVLLLRNIYEIHVVPRLKMKVKNDHRSNWKIFCDDHLHFRSFILKGYCKNRGTVPQVADV